MKVKLEMKACALLRILTCSNLHSYRTLGISLRFLNISLPFQSYFDVF